MVAETNAWFMVAETNTSFMVAETNTCFKLLLLSFTFIYVGQGFSDSVYTACKINSSSLCAQAVY